MEAYTDSEPGKEAYQKFPLLLPVAALGIGGHVGLGDCLDELPLLIRGLGFVPNGFLQLFPPSLLTVLLYQLPLGQSLAVIQHHCEGDRGEGPNDNTELGADCRS